MPEDAYNDKITEVFAAENPDIPEICREAWEYLLGDTTEDDYIKIS